MTSSDICPHCGEPDYAAKDETAYLGFKKIRAHVEALREKLDRETQVLNDMKKEKARLEEEKARLEKKMKEEEVQYHRRQAERLKIIARGEEIKQQRWMDEVLEKLRRISGDD